MTDYLSKAGANCLAAVIKSYWRTEGYAGIKTSVIPMSKEDALSPVETYAVRSNIGPFGYPPRHA